MISYWPKLRDLSWVMWLLCVFMGMSFGAKSSNETTLARMFFNKKDYYASIALLEQQKHDIDNLWLLAESYFHLKQWVKAKPYYEEILLMLKNKQDKKKASLRIFDILLNQHDIEGCIAYYVSLKKDYGNLSGRVHYGLGKSLYDAQYLDHAQKILGNIKKGDDFYARARYILASIDLDHIDKKNSIKAFNAIEKLPIIATEDFAVKEMAILAQARLLADIDNLNLAKKAYQRVSREPFLDIAIEELMRLFLAKAKQVAYGLGQFAKIPKKYQNQVKNEFLYNALDIVQSYRKKREITAIKPELETIMAELMIETARYDDARLILGELSSHYLAMKKELLSEDVWPIFSLNHDYHDYLGINILMKNHKLFNNIKKWSVDIKKSRNDLDDLVDKSSLLYPNNPNLISAKLKQRNLEESYRQLVLSEQKNLLKDISKQIAGKIAYADYLRALLVKYEMDDHNKQIDSVIQFQSKNIETFEQMLKKIEKGSAP